MLNFFGISKRKWLAFGILSAISASLNAIFAYFITRFILHRDTSIAVGFVTVFIGVFILVVIADIALGKLKEIFKIKFAKRYLAASIFGLIGTFYSGGDPRYVYSFVNRVELPIWIVLAVVSFIIAFVALLTMYSLSDFLAGKILPSTQAKSKSHEKKSKN